jgi:putative endonuclease
MEAEWFVYIIEAENGFLYTGISKDPARRLEEHREGRTGAKFFNRSPPKKMVFKAGTFDYSTALKLEIRIKRLKRAEKLKLRTRRNLDLLLKSIHE